MSTQKKILFPLLSLFLAYRVYAITTHLLISKPDSIHLMQFFTAFKLTLFVTGVFAFIGFAYPTNQLLPREYYRVRNPRLLKRVYTVMGVKYFKFLLLKFFWGQKENRAKYFDGTREGLDSFLFQTRQSEFGHLGAFVVILIPLSVLLLHGHIAIVLIAMIFNVVGNAYPVVLQRMHRARVANMVERFSHRQAMKTFPA